MRVTFRFCLASSNTTFGLVLWFNKAFLGLMVPDHSAGFQNVLGVYKVVFFFVDILW